MNPVIGIPDMSLVVLVGASGSGKSTFAKKHFKPTEVLSSDFFRGLVGNDENDQEATKPAFETLHFVARKRLEKGLVTVVDATNVQPEARKPLLALAKEHDVLPVAIVFDLPEKVCRERNKGRPDRTFGSHVTRQHAAALRRSLRSLQREGFRYVFVLSSPEEVDAATIERRRLWTDRRDDHGPFDIVGDVHGCLDELLVLLGRLGYAVEGDRTAGFRVRPPEGRRAVFLGDLVDRGPDSPGALRLAMGMVKEGTGLCIPGNHESKLLRKLRGKDVQLSHGLGATVEQMAKEPPAFHAEAAEFIDGLVSHLVLDGGRLVVAHAGVKEAYQGRASGRVRSFCLYGETTGETDEYGLPVRYPWAQDYRGRAAVVYGHTPVPDAQWLNNTICIDTGCVFGGSLTALRWPERELVSVPAARMYYEPSKPLHAVPAVPAGEIPPDGAGGPGAPSLTLQQEHDNLLHLEDVSGKRILHVDGGRTVTVREDNAAAALEVMSRWAVDPRWLVYLPPTMSPSETSQRPGLLEHPEEAFAYYRGKGVARVVCEEKHMGSRAVVVLCRDEAAALRRFGIERDGAGVVYTRTGRRFFNERAMETGLLDAVRAAMDRAGLWETLETDWVVMDAELMPWSAKARELLVQQYAPVGAAARAALRETVAVLAGAATRYPEAAEWLARARTREAAATAFTEAYGRYCWDVKSLEDLKLAPFHLMASEGRLHTDRDHVWHMETLGALCAGGAAPAQGGGSGGAAPAGCAAGDGILLPTRYLVVDLERPESAEEGVRWWEEMTGRGGEGMVVKPFDFVARNRKGLLQPAVKCRGPEYLRIIYGPEYTLPENLDRLRERGLGHKRSMAEREFALGLQALRRFVAREPLRRVHECVFGVLAMESEPVDPRL